MGLICEVDGWMDDKDSLVQILYIATWWKTKADNNFVCLFYKGKFHLKKKHGQTEKWKANESLLLEAILFCKSFSHLNYMS